MHAFRTTQNRYNLAEKKTDFNSIENLHIGTKQPTPAYLVKNYILLLKHGSLIRSGVNRSWSVQTQYDERSRFRDG